MPRDHTLPLDYYNTKKLIRDLSLPVEKIDACKNGCMLYWNDDIDLDCKFCGEVRGLCFRSDCRANDVACQTIRRRKDPCAICLM
ncbi:UNVERIFIED_CONTAM: hypothetical protein Scaly_2966500 [Sesamum calycinum]|uniref:Uncharacterized protein n=1 Tax=Sesamum calycinum TaxID=2727403 RepID=A0AAW2KM12_9LAMI